ncbi:hypothetical protein Q6I31_002184 [Salmonella enterica]|nr:hypothetical protein [Salmonella enterica]EHS2597940.1 hypothetical protein [Salmonella enterica]ELG7315108.1 hypothetical protein [Salmonella enterica]
MRTITRERLLTILSWRGTYGPGSNVVLSAEEAEELARITLVSLDATPAVVVPEEIPATLRDEIIDLCDGYEIGDVGAQEIWSACRLFIIQEESLPALV